MVACIMCTVNFLLSSGDTTLALMSGTCSFVVNVELPCMIVIFSIDRRDPGASCIMATFKTRWLLPMLLLNLSKGFTPGRKSASIIKLMCQLLYCISIYTLGPSALVLHAHVTFNTSNYITLQSVC